MGTKLTEHQRKIIALGAAAMTVLMAIAVVVQAGSYLAWRRWMPASVSGDAAETQPADESTEQTPSPPPDVHAAIKQRNVFKPPAKDVHGLQLLGVIGHTALFNKGAINEGESAHGVKVVSIEAYDVTIDYKGKTEVMSLFPKAGGGAQPSSSPASTSDDAKVSETSDGPVKDTLPATQPATPAATPPSAPPAQPGTRPVARLDDKAGAAAGATTPRGMPAGSAAQRGS